MAAAAEDGPVELPPGGAPGIPDASGGNPLQTVASVALTGAIAALLLRSLRRRSKRAKEIKYRASAVEKLTKSGATGGGGGVAPLPPFGPAPAVPGKPPSALATLLGSAAAAAFAVGLWRVAASIDGTFQGQSLPDNYTVRNITVAIRTLVSGACWLATFLCAANSLGLGLYGLQLAFGLASQGPPGDATSLPTSEGSAVGDPAKKAPSQPSGDEQGQPADKRRS